MTSDMERLRESLIELMSNADGVVAKLEPIAKGKVGLRAEETNETLNKWRGKAEAFQLTLGLIEDFEKANERV